MLAELALYSKNKNTGHSDFINNGSMILRGFCGKISSLSMNNQDPLPMYTVICHDPFTHETYL